MANWFFSLPWHPSNSIKPANFENLIDMARLDWKLIKIWKFDFVQNQIWLALISDLFFLKLTPNPSSINVQCIHIKKERKNWLKNPNLKLKNPWPSSKLQPWFQWFSINSKHSILFLGLFRVDPDLYIIQNHQETRNPKSVCSNIFQNRFLIFMHF